MTSNQIGRSHTTGFTNDEKLSDADYRETKTQQGTTRWWHKHKAGNGMHNRKVSLGSKVWLTRSSEALQTVNVEIVDTEVVNSKPDMLQEGVKQLCIAKLQKIVL